MGTKRTEEGARQQRFYYANSGAMLHQKKKLEGVYHH
jgi:hypothetical protein